MAKVQNLADQLSRADDLEGQARLNDYPTIRGKPAALVLDDAVTFGEGFCSEGKKELFCFVGGNGGGFEADGQAVDFCGHGIKSGWLVVPGCSPDFFNIGH